MTEFPRPLLKWVGGKSKLLGKIHEIIPKNMQNYHEPFVGGGSVLFSLLHRKQTGVISVRGGIYAYDKNPVLIAFYKLVQTNAETFYNTIDGIVNTYNNIEIHKGSRKLTTNEEALLSKESYFYWMRMRYNTLQICEEKCALFLILNKTCFRGLFRESSSGFNVPFGNYKSPINITRQHFLNISSLIQDVHFIESDCSDVFHKVCENDFVYLDPPYAPENNTSFVSYNKDGFGIDQHKKLFNNIKEMKGAGFLLSNSDTAIVNEYFTDEQFNVEVVNVRRAINSKNPESMAREVLINNV